MRLLLQVAILAMLLVGCSGQPTGASDGALAPDQASAGPRDDDGGGQFCQAKVVVGLYGDDQCKPGSEVLKVEFDIVRDCYGWSRQAGQSTHDNSATRFQCYRDRLCYTQHTSTLACDSAMKTDKESRTDTCLKDDTPNIWTRILSGTDGCPDAPAGFQCPDSDPGKGTSGLHSACSP